MLDMRLMNIQSGCFCYSNLSDVSEMRHFIKDFNFFYSSVSKTIFRMQRIEIIRIRFPFASDLCSHTNVCTASSESRINTVIISHTKNRKDLVKQ